MFAAGWELLWALTAKPTAGRTSFGPGQGTWQLGPFWGVKYSDVAGLALQFILMGKHLFKYPFKA